MASNEAGREMIVLPNTNQVYETAARMIYDLALTAMQQSGRFTIALSGGATPQALYELLAENYRKKLPWEQIYLFWGDERCVPPEHPDSNFGMVRASLLDKVPIPSANIFPMPAAGPEPERSAAGYEALLRKFFKPEDGGIPRFHLVLLGLGSDGHTASIFPHTAAVDEKKRLVMLSSAGESSQMRMTLTLPVINQAENVLFLVTGANKAAVLQDVFYGPFRPGELPAQGVRPQNGKLVFVLDQQAAARICQV